MLIAGPNVCLDITIRIPRLVPGTVSRSTVSDTSAGGKGINVARAATLLGGSPVVLGFLPAQDGSRLEHLLEREGIAFRAVDVDGVLRIASILLEDNGRVSVINGLGAHVDEPHWQRFLTLVGQVAAVSKVLICSGSLPPGVPVDGYRQLVDIGHRLGLKVLVDAAPEALRVALGGAPDLVSPNLSEAERLLEGADGAGGREADGDTGARGGPNRAAENRAAHRHAVEQVDQHGADTSCRAVQAATALHAAGAVRAVVTAGAAGAALTTAAGSWWIPAPAVRVVNPVGAGDCFAAGAALAMSGGAGDVDVVRRGMAAASASCETLTGGRLDPARAEQLYPLLRPEPVRGAASTPSTWSGTR